MSAMSDVSDLLRNLRGQGALTVLGGSHWKIYTSSGQLVGILPRTVRSDGPRARKNTLAQCRRAGFDV